MYLYRYLYLYPYPYPYFLLMKIKKKPAHDVASTSIGPKWPMTTTIVGPLEKISLSF